MGAPNLIPIPRPNDAEGIIKALRVLASLVGNADSTPTFAGLTLTGLTASRLLSTDASKVLTSADLYSWVTETSNQVLIADDGGGGVTFSAPQDIHTAASPTFANLSLGTGELTTGSINRASGTLTLEIGGTAEISITSSAVTLGGNLVIPDAGYIGSASDTDAIQIASDGQVTFTQLVTGILPTAGDHFATKEYVDLALGAFKTFFISDTVSGIGSLNYAYPHETGEAESTIVTDPALEGGNGQLIKGFITEAGEPNTTTLHSGVITFHCHAKKGASNQKTTVLYAVLSSVDADGTSGKTTITTTELSAELTDTEAPLEIHAVVSADTEIASTARLILDVYANVGSGAQDSVVTLYMEGVHDSFFTAKVDSGIWQNHGDVLDDLNTVGQVGADSEFLVGTGAGTFAWENASTAATSMGLGTGDSPTFANLSLGTGELTAGSINRASGTLTLEIGGVAQISITDSTVTLTNDLIIRNAGYIGSVSDTDAIQIESDGDVVLTQDLTLNTGNLLINGGVLYTDDIQEDDTGVGVTIDGVLIKDIRIQEIDAIHRSVQNDYLTFAGGNALTDGASIVLYGSTHATTANDFYFQVGGVAKLYFDASVPSWYTDQPWSTTSNIRLNGGILYTDNIQEDDSNQGVTIDSVLLKDGGIVISDGGTIGSVSDPNVMTIDASGNTTFSVFPITPSAAPDADYEVANKKYVDDGGGAHTHDGDTLQLDGINSNGGAFSFNTTGAVTFNQSISSGAITQSGTTLANTYQPLDAELTSLAALSYAAASFVKMTGANTFALRTIAQTADDLEGTIVHDNLASVHQGVTTGDAPTFINLTSANAAVNTTSSYYGIYNVHEKTAGITDTDDLMYAMLSKITINQSGGVVSHVFGLDNQVSQTLGDIGTGVNGRSAFAERMILDLNAGTIYGDAFNVWISADQEAAHTITGGGYGIYLKLIYDGTVTGTTYALFVDSLSRGLDYGIYVEEAVDNYFAGKVGIGIVNPDGPLHVHSATAGAVVADANGDEMIVEGGANTGISILFPDDRYGGLFFGSPNDPDAGQIRYGGPTVSAADYRDAFYFKTNGATVLFIDSSGKVGLGTDDPGEILVLDDSVTNIGIQFGLEAAEAKFVGWSQSGSSWNALDIRSTATAGTGIYLHTDGKIGVGTKTPKTKVTIVGTLTLKEQAAADGDSAGYGQLWVKNTDPCELWFTDDDGLDTQIV